MNSTSTAPPSTASPRQAPRRLFLMAITAALVARFFYLAWHFSANIFYWDEWSFLDPLFNGESWWALFTKQYGPQREGLGLVLTKILFGATRWNGRADSLCVAALILGAMGLAFRLKTLLFREIGYSDALLPLIFLSIAQFEAIIVVPEVAHAAMPLVLLLLYCVAWTLRSPRLRYGAVIALQFVLLFTGNGYVFVPLFVLVLALEFGPGRKMFGTQTARGSALALLALGFSLALFLHHYYFTSGAKQFAFPFHPVRNYFYYPLLMFGAFCGFLAGPIGTLPPGPTFIAMAVGLVAFASVLFVFADNLRRSIKEGSRDATAARTLAILSGATLSYAVCVTIGRVALGLEYAQASRCLVLLIPGFLAIYFQTLTISNRRLRWVPQVLLAGALISASFPLRAGWHVPGRYSAEHKAIWKDCYLLHEDIDVCNAQARQPIHPWLPRAELQRKLDFLKERRLNLFSERR